MKNCTSEIYKNHQELLKRSKDSVHTEMLRLDPNFEHVVDSIISIGSSRERNLTICDLIEIDQEDKEKCYRNILTTTSDKKDEIVNILSGRFKQK